jgi:mitochondrial import receptor subunit TOM40
MAFPVSAPGASEKAAAPSAFSPYLDAVSHVLHPVTAPIAHTVNRFHGWKESWGLVQPGTVENVTKEVSSGLLQHFGLWKAGSDQGRRRDGDTTSRTGH